MAWAAQNLWLIPVLPLLAAGLSALCRREQRRVAAGLAIGSMAAALLLSGAAFLVTLPSGAGSGVFREFHNFTWFEIGTVAVEVGWVLDPLSAAMLVMVSLVGLLIFIYSVGYMAHDENFTRFFCFLALFAAAMLGLVVANSLLLFFVCWELVGLASYLLIGFWFHKPSAAAAAKKAFITTRIGDLGLFLGLLWLYRETGTLVFYDHGAGCLESSAVSRLVTLTLGGGMAVNTAIGLLIFCGAVGKSGQVPLHVWLPDAMEGPTPVSALIHAATMVAAGVFLIARVYPLFAGIAERFPLDPALNAWTPSTARQVVTWVGVITALFAALVAVAQTDIKRILAYSTVSQLGLMMLGLGVGGVAVGLFHLLTHAFFKALLFLGAGSVIHGCHDEQDIRRMGGLRRYLPVTFATYAVGMAALAGVIPLAGFWSKDDILRSAQGWTVSAWPFRLALISAGLTAFYMTRQVCYVFFGPPREGVVRAAPVHPAPSGQASGVPHESPALMTAPLIVLAVFAAGLGLIGTPAWPWFQGYFGEEHARAGLDLLLGAEFLRAAVVSTLVVLLGIGLGWRLYGRRRIERAGQRDILERVQPDLFGLLRAKFYVDELYDVSVVRLNRGFSRLCRALDEKALEGLVAAIAWFVLGASWLARLTDDYGVNPGFDQGCERTRRGGGLLAKLQNGRIQDYLRALGLGLTLFLLLLMWGCRA